ncbi:MAG: hypothetical protein HC933_16175 [Pleurocapsa sp. SU_196_0]|nr:hypothetical protein [Pleurocapsa sp. SU_196_0]
MNPVRASVRDQPKGLELHEPFGRGGTDVGAKMARKLSSGDAMRDEDVKRVLTNL